MLAATSIAFVGEGTADSAHRAEPSRGVEVERRNDVEIAFDAPSGFVPPHSTKVMTAAPTRETADVAEPIDVVAHPKPTPLTSRSVKSAEVLFRDGNRARRTGAFRSARSLYRQLVQRFPRSRQASMARITLGRLELEQFGRPRAALAQYDAYLASAGPRPLAGEALVGRARAYRRLGQTQREIEAWTRLIDSFPDSAHVSRANQRLESLQHR
ncbi:MAG: tetratricopeptide repeat protein [Myxococcota bacterium]